MAVVRGMKKRRVWWIVGSFGLLMLGFVATVTVTTNTPDARMGRVLAEVIDEYGFEHFFEYSDDFGMGDTYVFQTYILQTPDESLDARIIARLSGACESCVVKSIELSPSDTASLPATMIETGDEYDSLDSVMVRFQEATMYDGIEVDSHVMLQVITRDHAQGILDKLRGWLPW